MNQSPTARLTLGWHTVFPLFLLLAITYFSGVGNALAAPAVIEGESVSGVSETSATLHAQLNTSELPDGVYYQFQLAEDPAQFRSEVSCPEDDPEPPEWQCFGSLLYGGSNDYVRQPGDLPTELLLSAPSPQAVSLDLSAVGVELQPKTTYHYRVVVVERVQTVDTIQWRYPPIYGPDQTFVTGPEAPPGEDPPSGDSPAVSIAPPPPVVSGPPPRKPRLNRCQRHRKHLRQKRSLRHYRVQCYRVPAGPRTRS